MTLIEKINIKLKASAESGAPELSIQNYEWTINGIILDGNTETITLNAISLKLFPDNNIVKLRAQDSAQNWSDYATKNIEIKLIDKNITILDVINVMTKTLKITVTRPNTVMTSELIGE